MARLAPAVFFVQKKNKRLAGSGCFFFCPKKKQGRYGVWAGWLELLFFYFGLFFFLERRQLGSDGLKSLVTAR